MCDQIQYLIEVLYGVGKERKRERGDRKGGEKEKEKTGKTENRICDCPF